MVVIRSLPRAPRARFTRPLDSGIEPAPVVGARGATLSLMQNLGLPVPPCFAITVDAFRAWRLAHETTPPEVWRELRSRLGELADVMGEDDWARTYSLAIRASTADRPPEMPTGFGSDAGGCMAQALVERPAGEAATLSDDTRQAVEALWRRHVHAPGAANDGESGIALIVQRVVPRGPAESSGRGLILSRDPVTGSPGVVTRFSASMPHSRSGHAAERIAPVILRHNLPKVHDALEDAAVLLESTLGDMCAIEFVVDRGDLWLLDAFMPLRSGRAAVRVAVDMIDEAFVSVQDAVRRIPLWALEQAQAPVFAQRQELKVVARAQPVAPGAGVGAAMFDAREASDRAATGDAVVLVARATAAGEAVAQWGPRGIVLAGPAPGPVPAGAFAKRPAVCHALNLVIDPERRQARTVSGQVLSEGDDVSVDGRQGLVAAGKARLVAAQPEPHVARVLRWCEELGRTAIAERPPSGWHRVATPQAARGLHAQRGLIDLSAERDPDARSERLREVVAAALEARVAELGLVLPDPLGGWDPRPPAAPWRLTIAPARLTWAAHLFAARVPLDDTAAAS